MYRFKYYYKDGTTKLSGGGKKPEMMFYDFDGLMDWNEYESLREKNLTTQEILELAMQVYKGFLKDFYRIEIVNDETNEVVDYIDNSESIVDGQKGHVVYDTRTGDIIGGYVDKKDGHNECVYAFKFYFDDGTNIIGSGKYEKPEQLYDDFDGLLDWDEYDSLSEKNLTTHEILDMAMALYNYLKKPYHRIEIINTSTGEIMDYIDKKIVNKHLIDS